LLRDYLNREGIKRFFILSTLFLLLVIPLKNFIDVCYSINSLPSLAYSNTYDRWRLIDKSVGIGKDLVNFSLFCKGNIPPYSDVLFFANYNLFKKYGRDKNYIFSYIPYRLRSYLYPIKVWWFKTEYEILGRHWENLEYKSKQMVLEDIDYVIGFDIEKKLFPGFENYSQEKEFSILKRVKCF
jgi:hypothetical protein